ncbi:hypothetical protein C8J57DRAFT_1244672 [Mycena rebaudengoi]|nr:hypothetical protein C8J57DRAFT_1244672 [Mycena rebaudengoi]
MQRIPLTKEDTWNYGVIQVQHQIVNGSSGALLPQPACRIRTFRLFWRVFPSHGLRLLVKRKKHWAPALFFRAVGEGALDHNGTFELTPGVWHMVRDIAGGRVKARGIDGLSETSVERGSKEPLKSHPVCRPGGRAREGVGKRAEGHDRGAEKALVMLRARLQAVKPAKPGPGSPSRAGPGAGLERAQGLGLRISSLGRAVKPGLTGDGTSINRLLYL